MGAEGSEGDVTRRAFAVVATVVGYLGLIAAILWRASAPVGQPAPTPVPAVPDEAQVASAVRQGTEKSRIVIQNTVKNLVPGVTCDQVQNGDTTTVRIIAKRDFYAPGKFKLADSPDAAMLASCFADVYGLFRGVPTNRLKIALSSTGTADSIPVSGGLDYEGLPLPCFVGGRNRTLEAGEKTLDNELLACARAAALAQDLMKKMPVKVDLKGREHGDKGGQFRSVDVEILFIGLPNYAPDVDFCG